MNHEIVHVLITDIVDLCVAHVFPDKVDSHQAKDIEWEFSLFEYSGDSFVNCNMIRMARYSFLVEGDNERDFQLSLLWSEILFDNLCYHCRVPVLVHTIL